VAFLPTKKFVNSVRVSFQWISRLDFSRCKHGDMIAKATKWVKTNTTASSEVLASYQGVR